MRNAERFKSGETLKKDIGPKLNLLVERSNRKIIGDKKTILIKEIGNCICISSNARGGGGNGGSTADYAGPFAVSADSGVITITAGTIVHTENIDFEEAELTPYASGFVYLDLSYSGSAYVAQIKTAAEMPAFSDSYWYFKLAEFTLDGSITFVWTWQAGDIHVSGRV